MGFRTTFVNKNVTSSGRQRRTKYTSLAFEKATKSLLRCAPTTPKNKKKTRASGGAHFATEADIDVDLSQITPFSAVPAYDRNGCFKFKAGVCRFLDNKKVAPKKYKPSNWLTGVWQLKASIAVFVTKKDSHIGSKQSVSYGGMHYGDQAHLNPLSEHDPVVISIGANQRELNKANSPYQSLVDPTYPVIVFCRLNNTSQFTCIGTATQYRGGMVRVPDSNVFRFELAGVKASTMSAASLKFLQDCFD